MKAQPIQHYGRSTIYYLISCSIFTTESECIAHGCYWCDGVCQSEPCAVSALERGVLFPPSFNITLARMINVTVKPKEIDLIMFPGEKNVSIEIFNHESVRVAILVNTYLKFLTPSNGKYRNIYWIEPNSSLKLEFGVKVTEPCKVKKKIITLFIRRGVFTNRVDIPVRVYVMGDCSKEFLMTVKKLRKEEVEKRDYTFFYFLGLIVMMIVIVYRLRVVERIVNRFKSF